MDSRQVCLATGVILIVMTQRNPAITGGGLPIGGKPTKHLVRTTTVSYVSTDIRWLSTGFRRSATSDPSVTVKALG